MLENIAKLAKTFMLIERIYNSVGFRKCCQPVGTGDRTHYEVIFRLLCWQEHIRYRQAAVCYNVVQCTVTLTPNKVTLGYVTPAE